MRLERKHLSRLDLPTLALALALTLASSALAGCNLRNWVGSQDLSSASAATGIAGILDSSALTLSSCGSGQVYLYLLDANGRKIEPALATTVLSNYAYAFTGLDSNLGLTNKYVTTPLLVQVSACATLRSRVVTSSTAQNLNDQTTLLASALNTTQGAFMVQTLKKLASANYAHLLASIYKNPDRVTSFNQLSTTQNAEFVQMTGASAAILNTAFPEYLIAPITPTLDENQNVVFNVIVHDLDATYIPRVEWRKGAQLMSTANSYTRLIGWNEQGVNQSFTLQLGRENLGSFDPGYLTTTVSLVRSIQDDFPAIVPPTVLASAALTRGPTVYLQMTTGAAMVNCATFSQIAITENDPTPPPPTAFSTQNLACASANAQIFALTLPDATDGSKTLRVWTQDSAGNVSIVPSLIFVSVSSAAPVLAFSTPAVNSSFNAPFTLSGTCQSGYTVLLNGGGSASSQTVACTVGGTFTATLTLAAGDGTKAINISQTDLAGNTTTASRSFILDTIAPVLTLTAPAANTSAQLGLTLSGACETGLAIFLSGSGLQSPTSATCTASTYSQAIVFTAGDGSKSITLTQTDLAGNATAVSVNFIKDTTPPALDILAPALNTMAQASVTLSGDCETGLTISYGGAGILSPFTGACAGSVYSQLVFFSGGDGSKVLSVAQTDAAGNTTLASQTYIRNNVPPNLTQTTLTYPFYSQLNSVTFGGACQSGLTVYVKLAGVAEGTSACIASAWSYATATQTLDGTYNYTFTQTDQATNTSTVVGRYIRDTVAPVITFTSSAAAVTASNTYTFAGNCESGLPAAIVIAGGSDSSTTTCTAGAWSYTTAVQTTDATRTYTFTQTDQAGNATTITATWQRNTAVPNLLLTTASPLANGLNSAHVIGNCETGLSITIKLAGVTEATLACPAATFAYDFATQTSDASRIYQFKQTNALALSTTQNFTWIRDTTPPVLSTGQFKLNGGAATTTSAQVQVALRAVDALTNITQFCLKTASTVQPLVSDSCWVAVDAPAVGLTPSPNLSLVSYNFTLPITPDTYSVYAWVQDQVGNISTLTNAGAGTAAQDLATIQLLQTSVPNVPKVLVGSTDYMAEPPSAGDLTVGVGNPIYIKWRVTDTNPFPTNPIALYFTTDDSTYTLIAAGLANGVNGACQLHDVLTTADLDVTGCYKLSAAPTGGYLKIRVLVTNSNGLTAVGTSRGLNVATNIQFLAGNTDPGTNLSAKGSMFMSQNMNSSTYGDPQSLVVTRDTTIYFRDVNRGILKVDPASGVQTVFLKVTGTASGDGGSVTAATLGSALKIAVDRHQPKERLYILENDRIRQVDLATGTVSTLVGPGADLSDNVAVAVNANISATYQTFWTEQHVFFLTPNGDLYFQDDGDSKIDANTRLTVGPVRVRYYQASTGQIKSFKLNNLVNAPPFGNVNDCQIRELGFVFNAASVITERMAGFRVWPYWTYCNAQGDSSGLENFDASGNGLSSFPAKPNGEPYLEWGTFYTGGDGNLYSFSKYVNSGAGITKYNPMPTGTWSKILGNADNQSGSCADGTLATTCHVAISEMFVAENGQIYFLDGGQIRTIRGDGTVVSLYGQAYVSPANTPALATRLGFGPRYVYQRNDGALDFISLAAKQIIEIDPNGVSYVIAGNGATAQPTLAVDASSTGFGPDNPYDTGDDLALNPATGDMYHPSNTFNIYKLTRGSASVGSIGQWSAFIDSGVNTLNYADPAADGTSNASFNANCSYGNDGVNYHAANCWVAPQAIGFGGGKLLLHISQLSGRNSDSQLSPRNNMLKLYDPSTKVQSSFVGKVGIWDGSGNSYDNVCGFGTALTNCQFFSADHWARRPEPTFDAIGNRWLWARLGWTQIYGLPIGGSLQNVAVTAHPINAFTYRQNGVNQYIYYCSQTTNQLRRLHLNDSTEIALPWPIASMKCQPASLVPNATGVVFIYQQNGLYGFAQYLDAI